MLHFLKELRISLLQWQAQLVLKKYKPFIIALTGSVGKTSTKDAVYALLKDSLDVRKNEKSYNGELGTPLTILGRFGGHNTITEWIGHFVTGFSLILFPHTYPKYLILEVGLGRRDEIRRIATWLHPDISLLTRLSKIPVHVEFFPTVQALIDEKATLIEATKKNGTVILNGDDEQVRACATRTQAQVIFYGEKKDGNPSTSVVGTKYTISYRNSIPYGIYFEVHQGTAVYPVELKGFLGKQHMYPVLAALAVATT